MTKYKVEELEGYLLDAAVAMAEGATVVPGRIVWPDDDVCLFPRHFRPSNEWSDAGPIIEREQIMLEPPWTPNSGGNGMWVAWTERDMAGGRGEGPLEAAMRVYVANKFGDEVELP